MGTTHELKGKSLEAVHSPAQALLISLVNGLVLKRCHPGPEDGSAEAQAGPTVCWGWES